MCSVRFVSLDLPGVDQVLADFWKGLRDRRHQVFFIIAPSMTTPEVAYFHNATSSLRAKATMADFFMRPPLRWTRSLNHWASAELG
jgi:hypothetical protein